MTCKNKHRSTTILEEILLDLYHHIVRLAWLIQEYLFLVKKYIIRTHTENSVEVGRTLRHITHSQILFCLFKFRVIADQLFYCYKFYLYQHVHIYIFKKKLYGPFLWMGFNCFKATATSRRQFTFYHYMYTFCLKLKKASNVI